MNKEKIDKDLVRRIIMAVKFERIRTKKDLKNCGCVNCLEALKLLKVI